MVAARTLSKMGDTVALLLRVWPANPWPVSNADCQAPPQTCWLRTCKVHIQFSEVLVVPSILRPGGSTDPHLSLSVGPCGCWSPSPWIPGTEESEGSTRAAAAHMCEGPGSSVTAYVSPSHLGLGCSLSGPWDPNLLFLKGFLEVCEYPSECSLFMRF